MFTCCILLITHFCIFMFPLGTLKYESWQTVRASPSSSVWVTCSACFQTQWSYPKALFMVTDVSCSVRSLHLNPRKSSRTTDLGISKHPELSSGHSRGWFCDLWFRIRIVYSWDEHLGWGLRHQLKLWHPLLERPGFVSWLRPQPQLPANV